MDLTLLIDLMILLGAALMVINITHYIHFTRTMCWMRTDSKNTAISSIPVVAMTANAFAEDLEHEKNAGMTAHVSKPLEIRDMFSTLARLLK